VALHSGLTDPSEFGRDLVACWLVSELRGRDGRWI
jgi:hypothetical protein